MGAHFEALNEDNLMAPLDFRYAQVGFNLISVQVCTMEFVKVKVPAEALTAGDLVPGSVAEVNASLVAAWAGVDDHGDGLDAAWPARKTVLVLVARAFHLHARSARGACRKKNQYR